MTMDKRKRIRKNLLYRLRRKGVRCSTNEKTIYFPYGGDPMSVVQIRRLCSEFGFYVQFQMT